LKPVLRLPPSFIQWSPALSVVFFSSYLSPLGPRKDAGIEGTKAFFVDVPGIGFAFASKEHRDLWRATLTSYLKDRPKENLKRVLVLVDSRHSLMPHEREFMMTLEKYNYLSFFSFICEKVIDVEVVRVGQEWTISSC